MIVISTIDITDLDNHEMIILPGTDILYHRYEDDRIEIIFRHSTDRFTCSDFDIENYLANTERNIVYSQYGKSGTEWFFEQQKDRTYREGVTKNYGFVDNLDKVIEDGKDKEHKRKKALFDKVNFMTLGAESDYMNCFKNPKIHRLYKQIEKRLHKLAILMEKEVYEKD